MASTETSSQEKVDEKRQAKSDETQAEEAACPSDELAGEEWKELMGPELQMKTIETGEEEESSSTTNSSVVVAVQPQEAVVVDFIGRLAATKDEEDGPIFQEATDWLVAVGEKDVIPALEMGIRFMNVGDKCIVWSHSKYAYGLGTRNHGEYVLPANSSVRYEVRVKSLVSEEERKKENFQLRMGISKKQIGNDVYANEWSDNGEQGKGRALQLYRRGAEGLEFLAQTTSNQNIKKQAAEIMLDCLNNIVAVHLRAGEYRKAKEAAVKVLGHDPRNLKALMRAARAALMDPASSYEEVDAAISAAEEVNAEDSDIKKLRSEFKRKKSEYDKKSKEMMKKMVKPITVTSTKANDASSSDKEEDEDAARLQEADKEEDHDDDVAVPPDEKFNWKRQAISIAIQFLLPLVFFYVGTYLNRNRNFAIIPGPSPPPGGGESLQSEELSSEQEPSSNLRDDEEF